MKRFAAFILGGLAALRAAAGVSDSPVRTEENKLADYYSATIYTENDLYALGRGTDRYYTTGQKLTVITNKLDNFEEQFHQAWMKYLAHKATKKAEENTAVPQEQQAKSAAPSPEQTQYRVTYSLGQNMYTPANLQAPGVIADDRPYAGWLYISVGLQARSVAQGRLARLSDWEVDAGVVGPASFAKQTQDWVHNNISNSPLAQGWANQLHNEPGLNFVYQHKLRWFFGERDGFAWDAVAHSGFSLGNVATYVNAGVSLRAGYGLPDDFGADIIRAGADTSQAGGHPSRWGLHVFAGSDGRAVARDIFLDGNTFTSSHHVARKDFVADLQYGLTINGDRWKLTFSQVYRTLEFKTQSGVQHYGSVTLTFPFPHLK